LPYVALKSKIFLGLKLKEGAIAKSLLHLPPIKNLI
jgi:hypothetical protein